jgi:hypothetical protein
LIGWLIGCFIGWFGLSTDSPAFGNLLDLMFSVFVPDQLFVCLFACLLAGSSVASDACLAARLLS